jgi:hypothetical protein
VDRPVMTRRRFPPPWTFEEANNACFIVKDANGLAVSYVYLETSPVGAQASSTSTRSLSRRVDAKDMATMATPITKRNVACMLRNQTGRV